jgi:hypothetical protein
MARLPDAGMLNMMRQQGENKIDEGVKRIVVLLENIIDNQNEHAKGLISIYEALEAVAKKEGVRLPEPVINMHEEK